MTEWFAIAVLFVVTYGAALAVSIVIDKLLRKFWGRGIWPKDYFK
jgi:hypothetical protein